MEEIQINAGEELGDDFYDKIEAPKFVDLTAPDHSRPQNDDRYWFCLRVGCDQKHEEEMDSEELYRNFVLRVMAARSPNVRFRKALCRKDPSANMKCPLTVPAKASKSRMSRLAMVSSISQKMVDGKVKARPLLPEKSSTPNDKAKRLPSVAAAAVAKSLTTPQNKNKKGMSNPGTFRSVRNPKPGSIAVPKNRVVAKALVFHSPKKKTVKIIKTAAELKKLEITGGKQFRGREVKSRVNDSLRSKNFQGKEAESSKCLKKKKRENVSSDMETAEKSGNGMLLHVCSTLASSKSNEAISDSSRSNTTSLSNCEEKNAGECDVPSSEDNKINGGNDNEEKTKSNSEKAKVTNGDDKENENATSSIDKESESKAKSSDDKENNSSAEDNRKLNLDTTQMEKKKILGKHETCKSIQQVSKEEGMCKTTSKGGNSASGVTKPKLTNPKPFRLRTDERQILKEANMEKKLHLLEPLKEITAIARVPDGSFQRKLNKTKQKDEPKRMRTRSQTSKGTIERKQSTTSMHGKTNLAAASQQELGQDKTSIRTKLTTPGRLGIIKESSPKILSTKVEPKSLENEASLPSKISASAASRSISVGRRHMLKSCTRVT